MGSPYPKNVRKTKACLCKEFSPGDEFSQAKVADACGSNPKTPGNHLPLLQDQIICGEKKLVKVEGKNRWTLVVPDDPFESPLEEQKPKAEKGLNPAAAFMQGFEQRTGLPKLLKPPDLPKPPGLV